MTFILVIIGAIVGGIIGGLIGFFGIIALAALMGVSDPNGGVAMGAATTGLPLGIAVGAALGIIIVMSMRRHSDKGASTQGLVAAGVIVAALAGTWWWLHYIPPTPTIRSPIFVDVQIRVPTEQIALADHQRMVPLLKTMQAHLDPNEIAVSKDGDVTVITATHRLRFATDDREIVFPIAVSRYIVLDLPQQVEPAPTDGFTDWQEVVHVRSNYYGTDEPPGHGIMWRMKFYKP